MTQDVLRTLAEASNFTQTGRLEEVERLSREFAAAWPQGVRSFEYGRSAEGRPMRALLVSRTGALASEQLRARKIPLLMLQGGIHPGESDGKDAGFIAIRELLEGTAAPGVLQKIAILFVPAFNTDGHERTGRWNRPNQKEIGSCCNPARVCGSTSDRTNRPSSDAGYRPNRRAIRFILPCGARHFLIRFMVPSHSIGICWS